MKPISQPSREPDYVNRSYGERKYWFKEMVYSDGGPMYKLVKRKGKIHLYKLGLLAVDIQVAFANWLAESHLLSNKDQS